MILTSTGISIPGVFKMDERNTECVIFNIEK